MAKTFDLDDPAQYQEYLVHTAMQIALYGSLYQNFNGYVVTVHDAQDVQIRAVNTPESHQTDEKPPKPL